MWINPEVPQDGDLVALSALFHNAEPNQLSGIVMFYDGNELLGQKNITIATGGVSTATVSFRISAGDHTFSATIGSMTELLDGGKTEPFVLSPQTVQLPKIFVPSKAGNNLTASVISNANTYAGGQSSQISPNSPLAPVVNQVNQLEGSVVSSIPDTVKNPVSGAVSGVETWRANNAEIFNQATKSASDSIDKINAIAQTQQKKYGKVPLSTNLIDKPFAYVKLFFFTLMSFLYSHPIVFYASLVLFLYIIFRYMFNKMVSFRGKGSKSKQKNNAKVQKFKE